VKQQFFWVIAKATTPPKQNSIFAEACFQKDFARRPEFQEFNEARAKESVYCGWTSYNPTEIQQREP